MSEERFDRLQNQFDWLQNQIGQVLEAVTVLQQDMTSMKQNQNALREDVVSLRHRIDSIEGTVKIAITDGFRNHDTYLDDLNVDLAQNERQTRRLRRRVDRLEGT
jgi:chromosome segregation ATPase